MLRFLCIAATIAGLASGARAQDLPPLPKGPPPQYPLARAGEKDGKVVVHFTRVVHRTKPVTVEENGKKLTSNVVESGWDEITLPVDGKEVRALGPDGKAIDPKDLPKRLAKRTQVVVFVLNEFSGTTEPDPFYLRVLREDVVVFAAPAEKLFPPPPTPAPSKK